jgi:hypothetical protein
LTSNHLNINNTTVQLSPDKSASIQGTIDIKLNNTSSWNNVKTNVSISKGKVMTINLDNNATSNHFQGQPIYGVVESIKDTNGNELLKVQSDPVFRFKYYFDSSKEDGSTMATSSTLKNDYVFGDVLAGTADMRLIR